MSKLQNIALALLLSSSNVIAKDIGPPVIEKYTSQGAEISVRIFSPPLKFDKPRSVIVLFHGGGWSEGEAGWMDGTAEQYADLGMVAISVDYRLSRNGVTPFDAVADARNAIRWVRREANRLGINPDKVVALGTSAGAHLAVSTAIFNEPWGNNISSIPNALVLRSPAVSVESSSWFRKLTGGAAQAATLSPDLYVRNGLPPTLILQGEEDNVTPASGAKGFCQRMQALGNICMLNLYPKVGHLFTRNLENQEIPDYDAIDTNVSKDANTVSIAFLRKYGFIVNASPP